MQMKHLWVLLTKAVFLSTCVVFIASARGEMGVWVAPPAATTYRELRARVKHHVRFLASHVSLAAPESLVIPEFFTQADISGLVDDIRVHGAVSLRDFWKREQEQVLNTEVLCREFIFLLVTLYHNLACARNQSMRGIPWLSLAALYMRLNAIPLNRLFDVLDECLMHYQSLMHDYQASEKQGDTLADWFAENWWLPTFMIGMAAATFVRWLRARQAKQQAVNKALFISHDVSDGEEPEALNS